MDALSHTIENNIHIRSLKNIPKFFTDASTFSSFPANQAYRPLLTTLNAIEYWMGNGDVFYFHLSSFFFYLLLCFCYYFLVRRIISSVSLPSRDRVIALLIAGLFGIHVVNAETINYISARSDSLSALGVVASLVLFCLREKLPRGLYLAPLILGMLVKPTIAVFPILLFFYILFFEQRAAQPEASFRKEKEAIRTALRAILPSLIVVVVMFALSGKMLPKTFTPSTLTRWEYALTQPFVLFHYFKSYFLPFELTADAEFEAMNGWFDDRFLAGVAFLAILITAAVRWSRKTETRPLSYGIIWFLTASFPTSCGIVPLAESMNDHRMFFPFLGLNLTIGWAVALYLTQRRERLLRPGLFRSTVAACVAFVFVAHAFGVYQRNIVWKDGSSLWHDVTLKRPHNGRGLMNYGLTLMARGRYQEALYYFEKASAYTPNYPNLQINLGIVKDAMGEKEKAEEHFKKAIALSPNLAACYHYYARFLNKHGQKNVAIELLKKAIALAPGSVNSRNLLMEICLNCGDWAGLRKAAAETLPYTPNDVKVRAYAAIDLENNPAGTVQEILCRMDGKAGNCLSLSLLHYANKDYGKAIEAAQEALRINPRFAEAYNNICAAYNSLNEPQKGMEACRKALELKPDFKIAQNNLRWAVSQLTP